MVHIDMKTLDNEFDKKVSFESLMNVSGEHNTTPRFLKFTNEFTEQQRLEILKELQLLENERLLEKNI